ncbi:ATP-binding protein [Cognatishimia sp. MH4019]|uniref:sensor histidine kinase n=1 Tax=Cognatishimia sp. MH4019 TaxID=2854030 RepID=UPI001CD22F55
MNAQALRGGLALLMSVALLIGAVYALNLGRIVPIEGAQMLTSGQLCAQAACSETRPVALPYFSPRAFDDALETLHFVFDVPLEAAPETLFALYLPKFSDNLDIWVNGTQVRQNTLPRRLWNTPLLVSVPSTLLQAGDNQVALTLYGPKAEAVDLRPLFLGPQTVLKPHYNARWFAGPGLARFAFGLMLLLSGALLLIWQSRRAELGYLWLGLSCLAAVTFLIHYAFGLSFGSYRIWTTTWALSASLYVLLVLKFISSFLGQPPSLAERVHFVVLVGGVIVILLSPPGFSFALVASVNVLTVFPAVAVLGVLWRNRAALNWFDFSVLALCLAPSVALGCFEVWMMGVNTPSRSLHLFHIMPIIMAFACLWLIVSQLVASLRGLEAVTAEQSDQIAAKSRELEDSFARLAEVEKRQAISRERDRIMLDLHDGIGGHLVSTLAYIRNNDLQDETLVRALEDALRDLALMLDSMETTDSLTTLLGMLRTRLEGLLAEHGLEFDWQIHGEPDLPVKGPSQNLHVARIVQEAITNVIKHAGADTITVYADEARIEISDNGSGFDRMEQASVGQIGHGLLGMKRRAQAIGAELELESDGAGTRVRLQFVDGAQRAAE